MKAHSAIPFALVLLLVSVSFAQGGSSRPDFKDYAVSKVYSGVPARPILSKDWRMFRTRIREGAKSRVEFAGHYTVPSWGCGTGCHTFVVVDSITGTIYDGLLVTDLPSTWTQEHGESVRSEYHPGSGLIKLNGCINEKNCGFYDYVMVEGKGLKLVRKELLPEKYQPKW